MQAANSNAIMSVTEPVELPPPHTVHGSQLREHGWAELTVALPAVQPTAV